MVDSPQIIFESLWPSWTGSSTITRITSEVVQNAVNVENIDFFGSFMEPRHQGIIWDGPQVKIRKLITRVTSLQSCTLLWACSRALTGPRYPNLGFFPHCCAPHRVVFDQTTGFNIKRSSFQVIICPATSFSYYPHRLQKSIEGILRPWKLTDEHAHTSGQVSDGVFK